MASADGDGASTWSHSERDRWDCWLVLICQ
jgi:hypothetical protein